MINEQNKKMCLLQPTQQSTTTKYASWDCKGADYATVQVMLNAATAGSASYSAIKLTEHSANTAVTDQSDVAAFHATHSANTDATHQCTFPSPAQVTAGTIMEFQVDLRKRERYMGLTIDPTGDNTTQSCAAVVTLTRLKESKESTSGVSEANLQDTNNTAVTRIVRG